MILKIKEGKTRQNVDVEYTCHDGSVVSTLGVAARLRASGLYWPLYVYIATFPVN